jgi:AraC-like DNA-binding protein
VRNQAGTAHADRRQRIIVRLATAADRAAIAATFSTFDIVALQSEGEFLSAVIHQDVAAAVFELSSAIALSPTFLQELSNLRLCIPVLIRATLTPSTARDVVTVASGPVRCHVSLIGHDNLAIEMQRIVDSISMPTAEQLIMTRIPKNSDGRARQAIVAAAIAARRRVKVNLVASICGYSSRGLDECMRRSGCPSPAAIIGWATSLHVAWRLAYVNPSVKSAAIATGFSGASALSNYMHRHVGVRPSRAQAVGGFWELLARFERALHWREPNHAPPV